MPITHTTVIECDECGADEFDAGTPTPLIKKLRAEGWFIRYDKTRVYCPDCLETNLTRLYDNAHHFPKTNEDNS